MAIAGSLAWRRAVVVMSLSEPLDLTPFDDVSSLVDNIERAMRSCGIWIQAAPGVQTTRSEVPFCADTMSFEQWLRWIFVPRMRALLRNRKPIPTSSAIKPMAETCLVRGDVATEMLLQALDRFDLYISARGRQLH